MSEQSYFKSCIQTCESSTPNSKFTGTILASQPLKVRLMMYTEYILSADKALCHLFLHCVYKDGKVTDAELDNVSAKFALLGLNNELNFKDEVIAYKSYRDTIGSESQYIRDLVAQINPTNELALFSYCLELGLSDSALEASEKNLLDTIGDVLNINVDAQETIQTLMVQRQLVTENKFF